MRQESSTEVFAFMTMFFQDMKPCLWTKCCPRIFMADGRFMPATHASVDLGLFQLYGESPDVESYIQMSNQVAEMAAASKVLSEHVPTYFIAPEIFPVLQEPLVSIPIPWNEMNLPHEGACFIFPKPGMKGDYGPNSYVWYARLNGITEVPTMHTVLRIPGNAFVVHSLEFASREQPAVSEFVATLDNRPTLRMHDLGNQAMPILVLNTLLLMQVEDVIRLGQPIGTQTKLGQEFWTPTVIGQGFTAEQVRRALKGIVSVPTMQRASRFT